MVFVSVTAFWVYQSTQVTIKYKEIQRENAFSEMEKSIFTFLETIEKVVISLGSDLRDQTENVLDQNSKEGKADSFLLLYEHLSINSDVLDSSKIVLGVYVYENKTNYYGAGIEYDDLYYYYPSGNQTAHVVPYKFNETIINKVPVPDFRNEENDGMIDTLLIPLEFDPNETYSEEFYNYDQEDPYEKYEYWIGEDLDPETGNFDKITPFISFSTFKQLSNLEVNGEKKSASCEFWLGVGIWQFSELLNSQTDPFSTSWLIDLKENLLLGTSLGSNYDQFLFDDENEEFYNVLEYKGSPLITLVTKYILENNIIDILKNVHGESNIYSFILNQYNVKLIYEKSEHDGGEWLFINVQTLLVLYQDSIIKIAVSLAVSVSAITVSISCLFFILFIIIESFINIIKEIKKIENFKLEKVNFNKSLDKGCIGFFSNCISLCSLLQPKDKYGNKTSVLLELRILVSKLNFVVEKLKEYKSFIPKNILGDIDIHTESLEESNSDTSSVDSFIDSQNDTSSAISVKDNGLCKFKVGLDEKSVSILYISFEIGEIIKLENVYDRIFKILDNEYVFVYSIFDSYIKVMFFKGSGFEQTQKISMIDWKKEGLKQIQFFLGHGNAFFGNLGCSLQKQFVVKSSFLKQMVEFQRSKECPKTFGRIFINEELNYLLNSKFETRRICYGKFAYPKFYEVGNSLKVKSDEWMYELQEKEEKKVWNDFNDAVELIELGKSSSALQLFKSFLKSNKNDIITKNWIKHCERQQEIDEKE